MVVNLYYENFVLDKKGFGYLIPRSIPPEQNPEGVLGIIFDSCSTPEVDSAPGTKLTVMLGGAWWSELSPSDLPTEKEAQELAHNVVSNHLGITQRPSFSQAKLQKDCIPQYNVGYQQRMAKANSEIYQAFSGRLRVAGSWYSGKVGVNDCIASAWWTAHTLYLPGITGCEMSQTRYRRLNDGKILKKEWKPDSWDKLKSE
jgi:protoporphyrinogen/coproporphyrinogen III oxidase